MNKYQILFFIFTIFIGIISYFLGGEISIGEQLPIYDSIRDVASIVFGVMGAWIAIVYPNSLKNVLNWSVDADENRNSLVKLFTPMRYSTLIVAVVTVQKWLYPALKRVPWCLTHIELLREVSFFILGMMVIILVWSLILTLIPMESAEQLVDEKTEQRKSLVRKRGQAQISKNS